MSKNTVSRRRGRPRETPRDRTTSGMQASFRRLAKARVAKVVDAISRLKPLADRTRYRYTNEETDDIQAALLEEVKETMDAFRNGSGSRKIFVFSDEKKDHPEL